jgi:hypothetical protein
VWTFFSFEEGRSHACRIWVEVNERVRFEVEKTEKFVNVEFCFWFVWQSGFEMSDLLSQVPKKFSV